MNTHPASAGFLQRGAIVAFLSFVFFLITLAAFYLLGSFVYFLLSTAFLIVYLFTLISWILQKRNAVSVFENGMAYKGTRLLWSDIGSVRADAGSLTITRDDPAGQKRDEIVIPSGVAAFPELVAAVRRGVEKG